MELDLTKKLFLCFSWENTKEVKEIAADLRHELSADIFVPLNYENADLEKDVYPKIEEAEIMLVFISDSSKDSKYVKDCVTYASNLNKRILPVEISKTLFGGSLPQELKFRIKPLSYKSDDQKAKLFSTLKASFGSSVESGDNYGMLIHIVTDMDASVFRYGTLLCKAKVNEDNTIRLVKGKHQLTFTPDERPDVTYSQSFDIDKNVGENFVEVSLKKCIADMEAAREKEAREAEARKKFEEEQLRKDLESKERQRELERQRQEQQAARSYAPVKQEEKWVSCWQVSVFVFIMFVILLAILASML